MASDLSSSCTEVNELFNDEKEEGEISLEDVSSSEEGQPYIYPPRTFEQCPYCLSTKHCAMWCKSLTINKNNIKREAHPVIAKDAGLQGKENRSRRHYHKDIMDSRISTDTIGSKTASAYSTLQEKNKDDDATVISDLVPISSDSDMELVGLGHDTKLEKRSRRSIKSSKTRRRRRNKSPSVASSSLSPSSIDLTLSIKDSIHRLEPIQLVSSKKESIHSKCHHHSPDKKKLINTKLSLSLRRHNRSRSSAIIAKRRTGRQELPLPPPPRKSIPSLRQSSPSHQREMEILLNTSGNLQQPSIRGNVTKLLKKVRRLEPFSSRSREKGSSLKDKLSNIMKNKKETSTIIASTTSSIVTTAATSNSTTTNVIPAATAIITLTSFNTTTTTATTTTVACTIETNKENLTKSSTNTKEEPAVAVKCKEVVVNEVQNLNKIDNKDDDDDLFVLRQIALETKQKKNVVPKSEDVKNETTNNVKTQLQSVAPLQKLPNICIDDNDDDLELRMIALRSAVLKKHNTRMQSGVRRKRKSSEVPVVPRIESPFTSSFIEDFPLLAKICSPTSPLGSKKDIYYDEDMDLDSDMELDGSPYSPNDDVGNQFLLDSVESLPASVNQEHMINMSLYSSSNLIKTSCHHGQMSAEPLDRNVMKLSNHESRPYSPTDATIYDPDLPGVRFSVADTQPLQPPPLPPLPPLDMLDSQQPALIGCTMGLTNVYSDSLLTLPMPGFSTIHQALNPLLLPPPPPPPPSTAPLFTCPVVTVTTTTTVTTKTTPTSESTIASDTILTNELNDFGETDLDGSPLVPIEQDNERATWLLLDEPLYLSNIQMCEPNGLSKLVSPIPQIESQMTETMSKSVESQNNTLIKSQIVPLSHHKEPDMIRSRSLVQKRKRKQSNTSRQVEELVSGKFDSMQENRQEFGSLHVKEKKSNDKEANVEDDEEVLREILLASLAKRAKDQPIKTPTRNEELKNTLKVKNDLSRSSALAPKLPIAKAVMMNQLKRQASQAASAEQPLRKIIKKTNVIPASTKVVNNAKRYQNLMIQRKLNQQKIALIASSKSRFKVNNNSNANSNVKNIGSVSETQSSTSPQITKLINENQRIIINLNEDTESESENEETKMKLNTTKTRPTITIPTTDFEKSVDQFLKDVRHKQEMNIINSSTTSTMTVTKTTNNLTSTQIKPPVQKLVIPATSLTVSSVKITDPVTTKPNINLAKASTATTSNTNLANDKFTPDKAITKIPSISATPQAVKHLPASQQEEYRRLKQQIFEREKLHLQNSKGSTTASTTTTLTKSSSILSSPIISPVILTSSIRKVEPKIQISTPSNHISPLNKMVPKTQLVATISPMSKQNYGNITGKLKIALSPISSKQIVSKPSMKIPAQSSPLSSVRRLQQVKLLDKMNDALNTQKKQIRAVAHKVSSLRILAKERLNLRNSHVQRPNIESESRLNMENLHRLKNHQIKDVKNENETISNLSTTSRSHSIDSLNATYVSLQSSVDKASTMEKSSGIDESKQNWEEFKKEVHKEVESLSNLSPEEQRELLFNTEEELITKRHSVLDDITEMSGNLRQWEIERDLQNMLNNEINKLREQLRTTEEKLLLQKEKLNSIQPKVSTYHEKINSGRKECFRLSKICNGLGQQIIGSNYNVPTAGAELLNNKIKEVAIHTQKLRSKKNLPKEIIKSSNLSKNIENSILRKENSSILNSDEDQTLIMRNINSDSDKQLTNFNIESLALTKKSILNIQSEKSASEIGVDNLIITEKNDFKNLVRESSIPMDVTTECDFKAESKEILEIGIGLDIVSTTSIIDTELNETLINTEQENKKDHCKEILTSSVEKIIVNDDTERKNSEYSISNKHSLLSNYIDTLKLKDPIQETTELTIETKCKEQFLDHRNESLLQSCSFKTAKKNVIQPYESILKHLQTRNSKTDGILCPYELMGTCNDGDCQFVHQSTSQCR
ncbi:PREDICTED: uncharacterized protein LOC105359442 [Ceratosolen solmsi marchali]|uniref:Uncharacterized protein LOC105359442 n=1 Tax=Ceratosolen solmsi marchali TaxID=326594 RepID=A0AAJ6VKP4_9HYME|nr:PREDICTED: uncharacterized protein LOC105359442 [Ceratosolen solmsi marchali]